MIVCGTCMLGISAVTPPATCPACEAPLKESAAVKAIGNLGLPTEPAETLTLVEVFYELPNPRARTVQRDPLQLRWPAYAENVAPALLFFAGIVIAFAAFGFHQAHETTAQIGLGFMMATIAVVAGYGSAVMSNRVDLFVHEHGVRVSTGPVPVWGAERWLAGSVANVSVWRRVRRQRREKVTSFNVVLESNTGATCALGNMTESDATYVAHALRSACNRGAPT